MSLVLATRFSDGTILACDPFVFDNDGEVPRKHINFDRFCISTDPSIAFAAIGSRWIFVEFCQWYKKQDIDPSDVMTNLATKWMELNTFWKSERESELKEADVSTLRSVSNSLLIMCQGEHPDTISIIDSAGKISQTSTFVFSGSGSYLVENYLSTSGKSFQPSFSLNECLSLIYKCYDVACEDLYVIGLPSILVVTANGIVDISQDCASIWRDCNQRFFKELTNTIQKKI